MSNIKQRWAFARAAKLRDAMAKKRATKKKATTGKKNNPKNRGKY